VADYRVLIKPSALKELEKLPKKDLKRIAEKIRSLSFDPRPSGCEKLSALERYRIRQGNYRVVYLIEDDQMRITIYKIGHRRNVYKG